MAPNPIMPSRQVRDAAANGRHGEDPGTDAVADPRRSLTSPLLATALLALLVATVSWARRWLLSGCAIESLILVYGSEARIFAFAPLWTLLATLNLAYAVCSTSWLLYGCFAAACYPSIFLTCLFQFTPVANVCRRTLRSLLRELYFTNDKVALFNLPALEIDTTVDGLFVLRGITIQLSSLTIVAHGIELGLKLADDIELALHADQVTIPLFRSIRVGDVLGNIKGGSEMTFAEVDDVPDDASEDASIFINDTPLLRAATAGSEGFKDRPKLRESLTGTSNVQDSSAIDSLGSITKLSPDDEKADKQYRDILADIRTSSAVYQSRARVRHNIKINNGFSIDNEKDLRAAVCAEMHELPSVPHPPARSVKVTTLQNLSSPAVRQFLHRLPFLLRLLLTPLSYFHPVTIDSVSVAGSGKWLRALLKQKVFKDYASHSAELRRLERRISAWLTDANFCLQLADITGQGQVPLSTAFDINAYLKFADIMAYRTVPESKVITEVVRLGGADATFTVPSFLLPHHEHILPPEPTEEAEQQMSHEVEEADGVPKTVQAEQKLEQLQKDETMVTMSVHGSLPACFDQSLLNFVAALVKATKVIEFEKEAEEPPDSPMQPLSRTSSDDRTIDSTTSTGSGFRAFTGKVRQGLKDVSTKESIRELAKELHQSTREGVKRAVVGGMVNDRWIAKMVGKVATKLEQAQGDLGYSGGIPVPLAPYRPKGRMPSKLLP